jgi:hypothetical protein
MVFGVVMMRHAILSLRGERLSAAARPSGCGLALIGLPEASALPDTLEQVWIRGRAHRPGRSRRAAAGRGGDPSVRTVG